MKAKRILSIILALILTLSTIPFGGMISSSAKTIEEYSVGDIIEFGSYPQSKVTDTSLISSLDSISKTWISYGYYSGTGDYSDGQMTAKDYMKYADISYGGNKYRAVKFTSYRPYYTGYTCSSDYSYQDGNCYYTNNVYYFKYEPLKWRILDPVEGYVMCESIIDSQAFNNYAKDYNGECYGNSFCTHYASDYANSSIRQWLNNDFYNTAFSSSEKSKIVTAEYENKSTQSSTFDSATTYDKITLLSYMDAMNSSYGFSTDSSRYAKGTDYAKCQGLYVDNSSGSFCIGNSYWLLRSPSDSSHSRYVHYAGYVNIIYYFYIDFTNFGVRPAFKFNPKSIIEEPQNEGIVIDDDNKLILNVPEGITSLDGYVETNGCTLSYEETVEGFGTGTKVNVIVDSKIADTYTIVVPCDVTGDGYCDAFDVSLLSSVANYETEFEETSAYFFAGDVAEDGFIDAFDLSQLTAKANYEI